MRTSPDIAKIVTKVNVEVSRDVRLSVKSPERVFTCSKLVNEHYLSGT